MNELSIIWVQPSKGEKPSAINLDSYLLIPVSVNGYS